MSFTVIIPARYASTRLPGKPLLDIQGKPMIQHVWDRACQSNADRVIVATDDQRVQAACEGFGAEVCMTREDHQSGTDRLQEVAAQLGLADDAVVVNVQGDEPLIPPVVIDQVAENLVANDRAEMATLAEPLDSLAALRNPNVVKVALAANGFALYFSRACIPWARDEFAAEPEVLPTSLPYFRHIGIYAYRVSLLNDFVSWPPGQLETIEKLEQLRALEQGARIHVAEAVASIPAGVDTQADLETVRRVLAGEGN
ncbi:3-deoxy-manno-octulosonate cytidylyltransferase (CMP-KDO synthetase) [Litorivivens lipolytica]|uniref:3-deoxy-manno-octulosonate cytidylyltransferase n=1 Tax=Litorivivens lipolytica TaxID=1524264 RepID=A0A7W4Z5V8_9GAMM|nr:3-deoxy-manno-octulosonate cytidylyltransferase [Litorivivens lipolytica]MBB3046306.1 3-deoxy-manno-octulosonate cytidylyltransferase (CMP-KDO synthetase) [Litorivivens lipolytica]